MWKISKNKLNKPDEDKDNTICIINIKEKDKDKSKCIDNMLTMAYFKKENELINNNNWTRKKTVILYLKYVKSGYSIVIITMHT